MERGDKQKQNRCFSVSLTNISLLSIGKAAHASASNASSSHAAPQPNLKWEYQNYHFTEESREVDHFFLTLEGLNRFSV